MTDFYRPDPRIGPLLDRFNIAKKDDATSPEDLKREIYQYGKRRCDIEASRDNLVYYLGFAFEVNRALDLDSLALAGLLSLPIEAFASIFEQDEDVPTGLIDCLRHALKQPAVLEWASAKGAWLQWKRLEGLYRDEVEAFRRSDAYRRPGWRTRSISPAQHYLIGEICRIGDIEPPALATRGQAFDFISKQGGNPRFWVEPPLPTAWWEIDE